MGGLDDRAEWRPLCSLGQWCWGCGLRAATGKETWFLRSPGFLQSGSSALPGQLALNHPVDTGPDSGPIQPSWSVELLPELLGHCLSSHMPASPASQPAVPRRVSVHLLTVPVSPFTQRDNGGAAGLVRPALGPSGPTPCMVELSRSFQTLCQHLTCFSKTTWDLK